MTRIWRYKIEVSVVKAKSITKYANTNYILDINKTKRSIGTSGTNNPNNCLYITSVWVCSLLLYVLSMCLSISSSSISSALSALLFFSASLSVFWNTIWNRYNLFVSCYRCSYCSSSSSCCSCYCCCYFVGCCCVGLTSRELRECSCRE